MRPKAVVLVPYDFSDESRDAVEVALDHVDSPSHLFVLHALPALAPNEPGAVWGTVDEQHRQRHALEALNVALKDEVARGANVSVAVGDPGHRIAEHAEAIGAELIVIPSHGRTGVKRVLLGSVAERVVRLAHCPVLVLKPEREG